MSKLMKLCIMHGVIVMLLVGVVLVANKLVVTPLRVQFQEAHTTSVRLSEELAAMSEKLDDAKGEVVKDLNMDDAKLLAKYIAENTDNLTKTMITDAADAIVVAAWENEVPLSLVVGIAQAVTGFNTTYRTSDNRGILAVSNNYIKASEQKSVYFNNVVKGADAGTIEMSRLLSTHKGSKLSLIVSRYLAPGSLDSHQTLSIFEAAAQFSEFKYRAYRLHIKKLEAVDTNAG